LPNEREGNSYRAEKAEPKRLDIAIIKFINYRRITEKRGGKKYFSSI